MSLTWWVIVGVLALLAALIARAVIWPWQHKPITTALEERRKAWEDETP